MNTILFALLLRSKQCSLTHMSGEWWVIRDKWWCMRLYKVCSESKLLLSLHYLSCLCFSGCQSFLFSTFCVWLKDKKMRKNKRKQKTLFHLTVSWTGKEERRHTVGQAEEHCERWWWSPTTVKLLTLVWGAFKRLWPSACPSVLSDLWVTFFFLRCFFLSAVGDVLGSFINVGFNTPSISDITS